MKLHLEQFRNNNSRLLLPIISFLTLLVSFCSAKSLNSTETQTDIPTRDFHYLKNDSNTLYIFPSKYVQNRNSDSRTKRISSYSKEPSSEYRSANNFNSGISIPEITESPEISGRDDSATTDSTPAPVVGAIDYVLMPLIILGTAAPIFVIMYVVMGIIEFKLPPNVQERSSNLPETPSSTWSSFFSNASPYLTPAFDFAYETVSRTLDDTECIEQVSCHIGGLCRSWGMEGYFSYKSLDEILLYFFPRSQQRSFRAFLRSIRRKDDDCSLYNCL